MNDRAIKYSFADDVDMADVTATLRLARVAVEALHGEDRIRFETRTHIDHDRHMCLIDTQTESGRTLAIVFGGYVRREFGDDAVDVRMAPADTVDLEGSTP